MRGFLERAALLARVILGSVFFWSGLSKVARQVEFVNTLRGYQILPEWAAHLVVFYLPWAEIALGIALLVGFRIRLATAIAGGLLLVFMGVIASAMARGIDLRECGCFPGSGPPGPGALLRDAALLAMAVLAFARDRSPLSVDHWRPADHPGLTRAQKVWQSLPLARKITLTATGIVALTLALVGFFAAWVVAGNIERNVGQHMLDLARMIASLPETRAGYRSDDPIAALQPLSEKLVAGTQADGVIFLNMSGIRYSHFDPAHIGKPYTAGDAGDAMKGKSYVSKASCVGGPSIRGLAPVYDDRGRQVGVVVVSTFINTLSEAARDVRFTLFASFVLAFLIGSAGAVYLAQNIKAALRGLEPWEIAALCHEREAMLHSIREGVVAVDREGRLTLVNEAAQKILNIGPDAIGRPVMELVPNSRLMDVVASGVPEYDQEQVLGDTVIITNRVPIVLDGEVIGAIATFRDKTEVARLAEELTGVRRFVEALRAQSHEFNNKLQVIAGLIELEAYQEAVRYIESTTRRRQGLVSALQDRVREPAAVGLLLGKHSEAEERGIALQIDPESRLDPLPRHFDGNALVLVLGNLIENALEAAAAQEEAERRRVAVSLRDDGQHILLAVEDRGDGIPPSLLPMLFEKGTSTKGDWRGLGLYLVRHQVDRAGGRIAVTSEPGVGTRFEVAIPRAVHDARADAPQAASF